MDAPALSTFSAISELFVTAAVFFIVFSNVKQRGFYALLAGVVIVFEFSVNMLYMIHRMNEQSDSGGDPTLIALGATHGLLSLIVFILLVAFSVLAFNAHKRGRFFFREHMGITYGFVALWTISVLSGETLYYLNYLRA